MMLAANILNEMGDDRLRASFRIPESYFLGSDVMYIFLAMNGLMYWNDQKYKPEDQIWDEYPRLKAEFEAGKFPPEILVELSDLLEKVGQQAADRAFFQPAGRQLWYRLCREVRQPFLPQPGHTRTKISKRSPGPSPAPSPARSSPRPCSTGAATACRITMSAWQS